MRISRRWRSQVWYVPLLAAAMALMMARPLVVAKQLDASAFAAYSAGLLVSSTFCVLGCMGLQPALQRKMPMNLVSGKEVAGLVLLCQCIIVALFSAFILTGLVAATEISIVGLSPIGLGVSICHGFSQQLFVIATIESRSRGEPLRFSFQNIFRAIFVLGGAGIAAKYGQSPIITLLVETIISLSLAWMIVWRLFAKLKHYFRIIFIVAVRRLLKIRWREPLVLMLVLMAGFGLTNMDRWFAANFLEPEFFGYYAFAWVILTASQSIQTVINSSIYPSLARLYAKEGAPASFSLAAKASSLFLVVGLLMAWPGYFFIQFVVQQGFSNYVASIQVFGIFIATGVLRVSDFWSSYLIIVGHERLLLLINITVSVVVLISWMFANNLVFGGDNANLYNLSVLALLLAITNYLAVSVTAIRLRV